MIKRIIIVFLAGFFIYACASVPVTGRRQLSLVSNEEILPMSFQQYNQVLEENKLSDNQKWASMVKNVGSRIQGAVEEYMRQEGLSDQLDGYEWEFHLLESDQVNAWCMPGGKVAFYSGIMPICRDETGVAVVMGHEVAHAVASHGRERMSETMVANGLLGGLSAAIGENPTLTQQILMQSAGISSQLGMLSFSRQHESEADHIGLIFMAMAGYDPREAPKFWERMTQNSDAASAPEFLSTHPHPETRISDLQKEMDEALKYYKK